MEDSRVITFNLQRWRLRTKTPSPTKICDSPQLLTLLKGLFRNFVSFYFTNMTSAPGATVRGVIFDLDGTLYNMRWYFKPIICLRLFPECLRLPRFLHVREEFAGIEMNVKERLLAAISDELANCDLISPAEAHSWIERAFYPAFVAVMPLFRWSRPGLGGMLKKLSAKGVKLAVLSDYGRVTERLRKLWIPVTRFDAVTSCEEAGALKPHPRPFLDIAEKWGIDPVHILVIGDRADTDGLAAKNAGMQFWQVSDKCFKPKGAMRWGRICRRLKKLENHC
jgi:putative hydrolase of the HAD superfamily